MDFGLRGKYALVAGGGRGIGKSIARELAREGVDVAIASRTLPELESTARELADETGQRIIPLALDVTKRDQVDRVVAEAAERLGGLHIMVNSAALPGGSSTASGPVEAVNDDDLIWDFDVKYVGALRCARAAIPFLKEQGWGRIVNISGHNAETRATSAPGPATCPWCTLQRRFPSSWAATASPLTASTRASSAPSALPACWRNAPLKPVSHQRRWSSGITRPAPLAVTPSAAWWNLMR